MATIVTKNAPILDIDIFCNDTDMEGGAIALTIKNADASQVVGFTPILSFVGQNLNPSTDAHIVFTDDENSKECMLSSDDADYELLIEGDPGSRLVVEGRIRFSVRPRVQEAR